MELRRLAAKRRHADRVLEQSARVAVVAVRRRGQRAERAPNSRIVAEARDRRAQAGMRDLRREEVEKAVELVRVTAQRRGERGGIGLGRRLETAYFQLEALPGKLDA